jgi:hypothetical protein
METTDSNDDQDIDDVIYDQDIDDVIYEQKGRK